MCEQEEQIEQTPSAEEERPKRAVVINRLKVRAEPSLDAKVVGILEQDVRLDVVEDSKDWYRIGKDRYVRSAFVQRLE